MNTPIEKDSNPPVLQLSALVPPNDGPGRTVEVDFKGVRFTVRHVNRTQLYTIGQQCTIMAYDPTTKSRMPKLDAAKLTRMLGSALVAGWSNATPRTLQNLMVLNTETLTAEQLDTPLPFTPENLELVLAKANGLDEFLQDVAMDPANFRGSTPETVKN